MLFLTSQFGITFIISCIYVYLHVKKYLYYIYNPKNLYFVRLHIRIRIGIQDGVHRFLTTFELYSALDVIATTSRMLTVTRHCCLHVNLIFITLSNSHSTLMGYVLLWSAFYDPQILSFLRLQISEPDSGSRPFWYALAFIRLFTPIRNQASVPE